MQQTLEKDTCPGEEHKDMDPRVPPHPAWCRNRWVFPCQQRADGLPEKQSLLLGDSQQKEGMPYGIKRGHSHVPAHVGDNCPKTRLDGKSQQTPVGMEADKCASLE